MNKILLIVLLTTLTANSTLYGLHPVYEGLLRVDPRTGQSTPIGGTKPEYLIASALTTVDASNRIMYMLVDDTNTSDTDLIGIDLASGKIVHNIKTPIKSTGIVGLGQLIDFDTVSKRVIIGGQDPLHGNEHYIYTVDVATSTFNKIGIISGGNVLAAPSAYDSSKQILWTQFANNNDIDIVGFCMKTGKVIKTVSDTENLETMNFVESTGNIIGIGLHVGANNTYYRTLLEFDGTRFNILAKIPGYFIIDSSIAAYDTEKGILYSTLQPIGKKQPFQLIGVNMKGEVVSNPVLCKDASACPWALEYA
eukprot:TRINITY_DN8474_c0_g1_i1.p1 TRINITY_DN8474_c0_g1~~TRINITY_DN8474_c0_g1_i1.p1  ORF type:complete len:308 (+),score=42.25 TRINITY_DN8474_c0_g1_i1:3-926(+)